MDRRENERALGALTDKLRPESNITLRFENPTTRDFFEWYIAETGVSDEKNLKEARRTVERVAGRFERAGLPLALLKAFYTALGVPLETASEIALRSATHIPIGTINGHARFISHCYAFLRMVHEIEDTKAVLKGQSQHLLNLVDLILPQAEAVVPVEAFVALYAELVRVGLTARQIRALVTEHPEVRDPVWTITCVGLCIFGRRYGWPIERLRELMVDVLSMSEQDRQLLGRLDNERTGQLIKQFIESGRKVSVCVYLRLLAHFGPEETEILLALTDDEAVLKKIPEVVSPLKVPLRTVLQGFEGCRGKVTFLEFIGLLDFADPRAIGTLLGTLEPDQIREIIGLIREIPIAVLSVLISEVPGLSAQEYRILYRLSKVWSKKGYREIADCARVVKWDGDWLHDCFEAETLGASAETVRRLVASGVREKTAAYLRHSQIEERVGSPTEEREVARALLLAQTTPLRAWVIRMARKLVTHGLTDGKAWKLAGILARTQRPRTRKRLLINPVYLERIRTRQPEIFEELETRASIEKPKKQQPENSVRTAGITAQAVPALDPSLASSISTMHRLLDISRWLPADLDLEHTQAIIVHGHLMPGQREAFIGEKYHDASDVPENVRNKLGRRWSPDKFERAHNFLMRAGVIAGKRKGDRQEKLEPLGHISDPTGQAIARAWIAFAAAYKSR